MEITPERWQRINEVFDVALELEGVARAAFLDEACAGDPLLRTEVLELLRSHERAGSFLGAPAFEFARNDGAKEKVNLEPRRRIGAYGTIREIGRGGMGTVYLAARADDVYRKQVAIKVVKRGMDTEAVVRGFRKERQILADLDHPHIARLLDGGTTDDGLPYFVMEYIEGLPLDVHCDTRTLSITQRLELFRMVCSAVQYAHERGVIHRDLKPSNILVTEASGPKLLDFGIAKVLNPEVWSATMATALARPLTPAYASPEQVRGEEITPASDIYSLGVILYELLAGHRPYHLQSHTPQELERVICEQDPEKPSTIVSRIEEIPYNGDDGKRITITPESVSAARDEHLKKLRQRLAGELDNIVLMALRKEPERRYASVEQFSADVWRHLEGRPVIAHKDTLSYRAAKFVRRHKVGVMTAASTLTVAFTLIGFGFYSSGQLRRTPDEFGNPGAAASQGISSVSATSVQVRTLAVLPFQPLVDDGRDEAIEFGITDALINKLSTIRQLTIRPMESVRKYGGPGQDLGVAGRELRVDALLAGSVQRVGDRIRVSVRLIRAHDGRVLWAESFDEMWTQIFDVEDRIGTHVARTLAVRLTAAERTALSKHDTDDPAAYREYVMGRHFWNQRTVDGFKQALQHFERAVALDTKYALARAGVAETYTMFASYRVTPPREAYAKARTAAVEALELDSTISGAHAALGLVSLYHDWNWPAAERAFTRALELEPENAQNHSHYALALTWFARFDEASREMTRALELDPVSPGIHANAAQVPFYARRYGEAIDAARRALALDPNFWQTHEQLGWAYVGTGDYDRAIASFRKAVELAGGMSNEVEAFLAHAYAVSGRTGEARRILNTLIDRSARSYISPLDIAVIYTGLGDRDQAFGWLAKAYENRPRAMLSLKVNPRLDPLRSDPRFADLMRQMRVFGS